MGLLPMRMFRLTIEQMTAADDLEGVPEQWTEFARAFGEVTPLSGREYMQAQQMQTASTYRIRTEFVAGCNPRMRLTHGERIFNVQSVVNVGERNRELEWMCTEVV